MWTLRAREVTSLILKAIEPEDSMSQTKRVFQRTLSELNGQIHHKTPISTRFILIIPSYLWVFGNLKTDKWNKYRNIFKFTKILKRDISRRWKKWEWWKRLIELKSFRKKDKGKRSNRRMDGLFDGMKIMRIANWTKNARNWEVWHKLLGKTKTHKGS